MKKTLFTAFFATAAALCPSVNAQDATANPDAEATEIWQAAAAKLEGAASLSATASLTYDVVQPSGRKLQFGAEYEIKAKRPNKFVADIAGDDGARRALYYDGAEIALVNLDEKLYATVAHEGSIESAIEVVLNKLNARMPLAALLRSNLRSILSGVFPDSAYIGAHEIGGVAADHVLLSNEYLDLQLWIDAGEDAEVHKALITYADFAAAPQFEASFDHWRFDKRIRDSEFTFEPDDSFERIDFLETQD